MDNFNENDEFKRLPPLEETEDDIKLIDDDLLKELFEHESIKKKDKSLPLLEDIEDNDIKLIDDDLLKELFEPEDIKKNDYKSLPPLEEIEMQEQDFVNGLNDLMDDDNEIQLY